MNKRLNDSQIKKFNQMAQVMADLRAVWQPYEGRDLDLEHPLYKDFPRDEFFPEKGQKTIGQAILSKKYKLVFVELARQTGKSELLSGLTWHWALMNPRSNLYYFGPLRKQVKDFIWSKNRIQTMNASTALDPKAQKRFHDHLAKYIKGKTAKDDMTLNWINQSQLVVDGIDEVDSYRGITADLIILDEFRDMKPGVYDALRPAIDVRGGTIVVISTPPHSKGFYTELADYAKQGSDSIYFKAPCWINPYRDLETLMQTRDMYEKRGEPDVWAREYGANFVVGGSRSVFPMVKGDEFISNAEMKDRVRSLGESVEYHCICDPGSADKGSAFAVLFAAYHPFTKKIFLLDEIYMTSEKTKTVSMVEFAIRQKIQKWTPGFSHAFWNFTYDEAATWFRNEMVDRGYGLSPTRKREFGKDVGISMVKDLFLSKSFVVGECCKTLVWELTNYVRDDSGRLPKKDDHLIDCLRYLLMSTNAHITQQNPFAVDMSANRRDEDSPTKWLSLEDDLGAWGFSSMYDEDYDSFYL